MGRKRTNYAPIDDKRLFLKVVVYSRELKKYLVLYEQDNKLHKTWEPVRNIPNELVVEYRSRCEDNNLNISKDLDKKEADDILEQVDTVIDLTAGHRPVKRSKFVPGEPQEEPAQEAANDNPSEPPPQPQPQPQPEPQQPPPERVSTPDPDSVILSLEEHKALLAKIPKEDQMVLDKDLYSKLKQAMFVYKKAVETLRGKQDVLWSKYSDLLKETGRPVPDPKTFAVPNSSPDPSINMSPNSDIAKEPEAEAEPPATPASSPHQQAQPCPTEKCDEGEEKEYELPPDLKKNAWDFYHFLDISVRSEDTIVKRAIMQKLKKVHADKVTTLRVSDETKADMQHMAQVLIFMKETLLNNRTKYDKFLARIEKGKLFCPHGGLNTDINALNIAMADSKTIYNPAQKYFVPKHMLDDKPSRAFLCNTKKPSMRPPYRTPTNSEVPYSKFAYSTPRSYVPPGGKPFTFSENNLYSSTTATWYYDMSH